MIKFGNRFDSNKCKVLALAILTVLIFALVSCSGGERESEIKSVRYSPKTEMIEVEATLCSADVREFRGETVYLIEVPANNSVDDILTLIPAAQTKSGAEMKFSLPLREGARTRLYSGFVLAVFDRMNGYIALSDVRYLDNPESLAVSKSAYPEYPSIKGLSIVSSSEATLLGVKHTVIRIPIEQYILAESGEGAQTYIFDGESHYYNSARVAELDYKIKNLTGAGIEVILEFTLDTPPEKLPFSLISIASKKPTSAETEHTGGSHYAISVTGGDSYRHIAALFEFFSERYTRSDAKYGFAGSFIIGNGVNSLTDTGIDDARTLSDAVYRYEKLLRIAETALRSRYENGKVFVSLDNKWSVEEQLEENTSTDPVLPVSQRDAFGIEEFLGALFDRIELGGKYEVDIALMPNASDESSAVWNDIGASESADSEYLTVKNLSLLRTLVGKDREMIIYNYGISADDEKTMAASYAYAFLKAVEADVSAFIYNGQADGLTGNGETGLMKVSEDGKTVEKREIYDVFLGIDVIGAPEPESARLRIGGEWSALYEKYGERAGTSHVTLGEGSTVKNESDKKLKKATSTLLFDFSEGKSFDFFPSDSAYYIEIGDELGARALKSGLASRYKGEYMGVRSSPIPYEKLDGALQITVELSTDPGEGNTAKVMLALVQSGENKSILHTSSAILQASNRQTVYFDIREAKINEKYGDVLLYIWVESTSGRSPVYSGEEGSEQYILIENISVEIKKQTGAFLWILIITLLLALIVGVLYFTYKRSTGAMRGPRCGGRPQNIRKGSGVRKTPPYGAGRPYGQYRNPPAGYTQRPYPNMPREQRPMSDPRRDVNRRP